MRYLLDTHIALWWLLDDGRASNAQSEIAVDDEVYVSQVSLWELCLKRDVGKLGVDPETFEANIEPMGFSWLRLENVHLLQVNRLPKPPDHGDPFDRLLVAQAQSESLLLLTVDAKLGDYAGVRVL